MYDGATCDGRCLWGPTHLQGCKELYHGCGKIPGAVYFVKIFFEHFLLLQKAAFTKHELVLDKSVCGN